MLISVFYSIREKANNINNIPGNKKNLERLIEEKKYLVPFIGTGFSAPACPTWSKFLELFFKEIKGEYLLPEEEEQYLQLKNSNQDKKYEKMADFLMKKSGRRKSREEIVKHFDKILLPEMETKFQLMHQAFPGIKITTNFDCLIENNGSKSHVKICYGYQQEEIQRLFTYIEQNSLLKIHGDVMNISSIILSSANYETIYGDNMCFDPDAHLPAFLTRVFTNRSVLFIGCSLVRDRIIMIMESLQHMHPHFAVMRWPENQKERVLLNRSLSKAGITPIWITDFVQIEEILEQLGPPINYPVSTRIKHDVPFVGRNKELKEIRKNLEETRNKGSVQMITGHLFNIDGAGGVGKTSLAIEVAKRFPNLPEFKELFKDGVLGPIRVDEHTPISFAMHLANKFHFKDIEPSDENTAQELVTTILKDRYALLILDNAVEWDSLKYMLPTETCSTILITTRNRDMFAYLHLEFDELQVHEISLEIFTKSETLALFRRMLGRKYRAKNKDIYIEIATNLGFLPIALRQAISLMLFEPRYTASDLRDKLVIEDRLDVLRSGQAVKESDSMAIESIYDLSSPLLNPALIEALKYLAICSPKSIPLDFLRELAKNKDIEERLEKLYTFSWCDRREIDDQKFYELHQLVRRLVKKRYGNCFREEFIQLVNNIFMDDSLQFSTKEKFMPQLEEALNLAAEQKDKRIIKWVFKLYRFWTYRGYTDFYLHLTQCVEDSFPDDLRTLSAVYGYRALILERQGKLDKAMELLKKEEKICEELDNKAALARSYGNQALIRYSWGEMKEAMTLHKKEEEIYIELGDRAGLAICYGDQALILKAGGKLDEAMTLHKKEEKIAEELGDRSQLARSYGNQARILKARGELNEAMTLHKKEEKIKEELGDRAGLSRSYGNQAVILYSWGELNEAMKFHKKEEKIKKELGDRPGLARSYGNQALILYSWGKFDEAMTLHKKEEKIAEELGDRLQLARSYGNQALILYSWRKLKKAMTLHKKEEKIKKELGDRTELATCYGNQAVILREWGKLEEAMALHKKEEKICEKLGDRAGLAICYGNQAVILREWGKPDDSMTLHKKEENICKKLGDRANLAKNWWNQGLIYNEKKDYKKQAELWQKSIDMNDSIGIPTEKYKTKLQDLLKKIKKQPKK